MNHIKKKFLLELVKDELPKPIESKMERIDAKSGVEQNVLKEKRKGNIVLIGTEDDRVIGGFIHPVHGKNYVFPVPDPALVYFHSAQINVKSAKEIKKNLLEVLNPDGYIAELGLNEIYNYYGSTSTIIISLFTALEAFINRYIPKDYIYNKKTESYDRDKILRHLDFKTKATIVLTEITNRNFFKENMKIGQKIWQIKDLRDKIVHTKPENLYLQYDDLLKEILQINFDDTLNHVAFFMNYYIKDYITECDCGNDY